MISNQILQNTIEGLKGITRIDFCVMDTDGKSLASTFSEQENYVEEVISFVESPADSQVVQGYQFFKIFDEHQLEYILLANGGSDDVYMVGKIAAFQIQNLLVAYKERFDKDNFIKNLLLDNLLLVDIYNRSVCNQNIFFSVFFQECIHILRNLLQFCMSIIWLQFFYHDDIFLINGRHKISGTITKKVSYIIQRIRIFFVLCFNNKDNTSYFCVNM